MSVSFDEQIPYRDRSLQVECTMCLSVFSMEQTPLLLVQPDHSFWKRKVLSRWRWFQIHG